jgi:hypothetical protein
MMATVAGFTVLNGSGSDYEGPVRARKVHPCSHSAAHGWSRPLADVACRGPIQPGEMYVRVRMGSWLEYDPVRIECLAAAGVIRMVTR